MSRDLNPVHVLLSRPPLRARGGGGSHACQRGRFAVAYRRVALPREGVRAYAARTQPAGGRAGAGQRGREAGAGPAHRAGCRRRARLGVVLAIDASSSMRGRAFAEAFDAARAFAHERNGRQPFALVTFGTESRVALPFTGDENRIGDAMRSPGTPSGGTHMYDAALRSVKLVRDSGLPGGFVVVLSDGTDHGSKAGSEEVLAAARRGNVRVYTVGLARTVRSRGARQVGRGRRRRLLRGRLGHGAAGDLPRLGAQLSNAYTIRYRSLAGPGRPVHVRAAVAGHGTAGATYRSPRLGVGGPAATEPSGWDSPFAMAAAIALVVGLLGLALLMVLRSRLQTTRERVAQFVRPPRRTPATRRPSPGAWRPAPSAHSRRPAGGRASRPRSTWRRSDTRPVGSS